MKNYRLFFLVLFFAPFILFAQSGKGKVTDSKGAVLAGANVLIDNQAATVADQQGNFTFTCSPGLTVTVSYIGYEAQTQTVTDCTVDLIFQLSAINKLLDDVEIISTSIQNKSILNQPYSVAKLGENELKRNTGLFLDDAINANVPGVFMERRTVSAGQQFNIRGYGSGGPGGSGASNNFDSQGIKAYLNGIPLTDAEGITLMDDIDFGSIGNVEILKGPSGTLYGLAVAGVVNMQTVRAQLNKTSVSENMMVGSYGLRRSTTTLQMGSEKSSLLINYGDQNFDGFMQHTHSQKKFVNVMGDFHLNGKQSLTTYVGWSNSYDNRNGELSITQYNNFDYSGNPAYLKNDAHSNIISFRAGVGHTYHFTDKISNTTSVFGTGMSNNSSSAAGWTDKAPFNSGLRSTFDMKFNLSKSISLSGISGIEAQQQFAQTIGYGMVKNNADTAGYNIIGAMKSNQTSKTSTYSLFTQWTLTLPHDFTITAGVGSSSMNITLYDKFYVPANNVPNATVPTTYITNYNNLVSPSVAINKLVMRDVSVYVSCNKGYKAPVASNIYTPLANSVNTSLRPEMGQQFEIGSKGHLYDDKLSYEVAYFTTTFTDKMTTVAVPNATNTATAYTYTVNSGSLDNNGLEISVKYAMYRSESGFIKSLKPFANFTYSDFKYKNFTYQANSKNNPVAAPVDYTGKAVAGVPKNVYNLGMDLLTRSGFYFNLTYMHRDPMPITSDNTLMTKAYDLINSKIGYRQSISEHFNLDAYFGANNIGNCQYYQMVFINQQPDTFLPGPRWVNYFGGLNLKYTF